MAMTYGHIVYRDKLPWLIRLLGGRWRDSRHAYHMSWGELILWRWGWACSLCMFSETFSLQLQIPGIRTFIHLPMLQRWHREPHEIMESWGIESCDNTIHFKWGRHYSILHIPWSDWVQVAHEVRRPDGSWVPFVGSWEEGRNGKEPDGRLYETYYYKYVLRSGEVQHRTATISTERRTRKLRWFQWLPYAKVTHSIDVRFSDEVGERSGSWKGGTIGCGYELRPDETPRECLRRMERDRRFDR